KVLSKFVEETVDRLLKCGRTSSLLVEAWSEFNGLSEDQRRYCELVGSLGTSPADASDLLSDALERFYDHFGYRAARDFCLAATASDVVASKHYVDAAKRNLEEQPPAALEPLLKSELPPENFGAPSWRRGMNAAKNARAHLKVDMRN